MEKIYDEFISLQLRLERMKRATEDMIERCKMIQKELEKSTKKKNEDT